MNAARAGKPVIANIHATVYAWGNPEGFAECAGKGFKRTVLRIESDFGNCLGGSSQLPGRALEEQAAPHCCRGFGEQSAKEPMEPGAALIGAAREVGPGFAAHRISNYLV